MTCVAGHRGIFWCKGEEVIRNASQAISKMSAFVVSLCSGNSSHLAGRILYLRHCFGLLLSLSAAAAVAKSLQSCLTLCNPVDGNPLGSPVPGILQARTLEWVAVSFSNLNIYHGLCQKRKGCRMDCWENSQLFMDLFHFLKIQSSPFPSL